MSRAIYRARFRVRVHHHSSALAPNLTNPNAIYNYKPSPNSSPAIRRTLARTPAPALTLVLILAPAPTLALTLTLVLTGQPQLVHRRGLDLGRVILQLVGGRGSVRLNLHCVICPTAKDRVKVNIRLDFPCVIVQLQKHTWGQRKLELTLSLTRTLILTLNLL